jgi:hypothetical protein
VVDSPSEVVTVVFLTEEDLGVVLAEEVLVVVLTEEVIVVGLAEEVHVVLPWLDEQLCCCWVVLVVASVSAGFTSRERS